MRAFLFLLVLVLLDLAAVALVGAVLLFDWAQLRCPKNNRGTRVYF
jgi:hypothetical protein